MFLISFFILFRLFQKLQSFTSIVESGCRSQASTRSAGAANPLQTDLRKLPICENKSPPGVLHPRIAILLCDSAIAFEPTAELSPPQAPCLSFFYILCKNVDLLDRTFNKNFWQCHSETIYLFKCTESKVGQMYICHKRENLKVTHSCSIEASYTS